MISCALIRDYHPELLNCSARLLLEANYRGPWRMIYGLLKGELGRAWSWYIGNRWTGAEVEAERMADRVREEEEELLLLVKSL